MSIDSSDLLHAFGEAILVIDRNRKVSNALGNTQSIFGQMPSAIVGQTWRDLVQQATPEVIDGLYWVIEAAFDRCISPQFLPPLLPFKANLIVRLAILDTQQVALRFLFTGTHSVETLFYKDLRSALTSTVGFTDVLLKGIDGPLTDLQVEDLGVIHNNAQFAQHLVEDWRNQFVKPLLVAPVPVAAAQLLTLHADDLPRRKLASYGLTIEQKTLPDVMLYSSGAIRLALINLIRVLPQYLVKQSQIEVAVQVADDLLEVHLRYRATDNGMKAAQYIAPVDLFQRHSIKYAGRLQMLVSAAHAQLAPYGCSAWALPIEGTAITELIMTVPLWSGTN
ncbi:MAG: hypothetical protein ABI947_08995 [Chloroflexota bacterium]